MRLPTLVGVSFARAPYTAVLLDFRLGVAPIVTTMAIDAFGEPLADQLDLDGHAALFTHMACAGLSAPHYWRVPKGLTVIASTLDGQLARIADSIGDGRALLASASAASASALMLAVGAARVAHAVAQPGIYDAVVKALRLWLPPPAVPSARPASPRISPTSACPPTALGLAFEHAFLVQETR